MIHSNEATTSSKSLQAKPLEQLPSLSDSIIRIALIGCGRISANHFAAIEKHDSRIQLVDVCDNNPEVLTQAINRTNAKGHNNLTELLQTTSAVMVVLTTPSGLHPDQAIQVAQ